MAEFAPYHTRPVSFLGTRQCGAWGVKVYGICSKRPQPEPAIVQRAWDQASHLLRNMMHDYPVHGAAFLIVHEANDGSFFLLNWWTGENMLASRVFYAAPGSGTFIDFAGSRIACCVWELEVIKYERDRWVQDVLGEGKGDIAAYLQGGFEGHV